MPREDRGVLIKDQQFLLNALDQGVIISSRKVRSSDASLKQYIPGKQETIVWGMQDYGAPGVSGNMDDVERGFPEAKWLAFFQVSMGIRRLFPLLI